MARPFERSDGEASPTQDSDSLLVRADWPAFLRGRRLMLIEVLLIFLVFFSHAAWPVPEVNEVHYLGKAKHYWNPDWCRGDFFLETADAHQTYYWTIGWLTRFVSLPAVAWIGRLATWLLLAIAWRRLSFLLIPVPLVAVLSAALFVTLSEHTNLAGEWVVGGLEAKGFAYVLVLLAWSEVLRDRWNRVWLLLGGAAMMHVLVGGWAALAAGVAWLMGGRQQVAFRAMLPGLAGGFALSLVGLIPALALTRGVDPAVVSEANQIYVFKRLPHHLALHTLKSAELQTRLVRNGLCLLAFAALAWTASRSPTRDEAMFRRLRWLVLATIGFAVCGAIISTATAHHPQLAAAVLRYYWYRLYDFALPLGVSLFAVEQALVWLPRRRALAVGALVLLVLFPAAHLARVAFSRTVDHRAPADRKMADADDWVDACLWIRQHTPRDAVFFTPRGSQSLKWYAQRAEVVNQKDIPQDAPGIVEWQRRIDDLYPIAEFETGPGRLSLSRRPTDELSRLAKKYGVDFVITTKAVLLDLPQRYQNNSYIVYAFPYLADAGKTR